MQRQYHCREKKSNNYLFPPLNFSMFPKELLPQNTPTLDTASLGLGILCPPGEGPGGDVSIRATPSVQHRDREVFAE